MKKKYKHPPHHLRRTKNKPLTPEKMSWVAMNVRCNNPRDKKYPLYGGRGIAVCDRWKGKNGFSNFLADMGPRPAGLTLDRIDGAKGYFPENCRWADYKTQNRNRSFTRMLTVRGETKALGAWAEQLGISPDSLYQRVRSGWSDEDAVLTPVRPKEVGLSSRLRAIPVGDAMFLPGKTSQQAHGTARHALGRGAFRTRREGDGVWVHRLA